MSDAAQEFAERVVHKAWCEHLLSNHMLYSDVTRKLAALITDELRAGGWCPKTLNLPTPPSNLIYPKPPPGYEAMRASFERNRD